MPWLRDEREFQATASRGFTRLYVTAFGIAALIGLVIGIMWVVAGILHFHPLW
jgi:hypothetical protein